MACGALTVAWHLARMGLATALSSICPRNSFCAVNSLFCLKLLFFLINFWLKLLSAWKEERQLLLFQATRLEKNRRARMTHLLIIRRLWVWLERARGRVSASFVQSDSESVPEMGTIHGCPQGSYWELLSCQRSLYLHCCMPLHFILARSSRRTSQKPPVSARPFFQHNIHVPQALEPFFHLFPIKASR